MHWTEPRALGAQYPIDDRLAPTGPAPTTPLVFDLEELTGVAQMLREAPDSLDGIESLLNGLANAVQPAVVEKRGEAEVFVSPFKSDLSFVGPRVVDATLFSPQPESSVGPVQAYLNAVFGGGIPTLSDQQIVDRKSVGVVDFSIAFLNRRFRRGGGLSTRFEMLWIQDRTFRDPSNAPPYAGLLGIGTLLLRTDIDALIARHTHDGWLDEAAAYGEFTRPGPGFRDAWVQRIGHGTAILDHMAGAEPGTEDDKRPIFGVELPTAALANTSGNLLMAPMLAGLVAIAALSYLQPLAQGQNPKAPLVMNASLAFTGGPDSPANTHAQQLASVMEALQEKGGRPVWLTVPNGNHLQDRIYGEVPAQTDARVQWMLPYDDRTISEVEILSGQTIDTTGMALNLPGQKVELPLPHPLDRGTYSELVGKDGGVLARVLRPAETVSSTDMLVLSVAPTYHPSGDGPLAPAGIWNISLPARPSGWTVWVRRDETLNGFYAAGRQSRLRDGGYRRFDFKGGLLKQV